MTRIAAHDDRHPPAAWFDDESDDDDIDDEFDDEFDENDDDDAEDDDGDDDEEEPETWQVRGRICGENGKGFA